MNTKNSAQYETPGEKQNTSACTSFYLARQSWELITTVSFRGGLRLIKMPHLAQGECGHHEVALGLCAVLIWFSGVLIEQNEPLNTQNSTLNKLICREIANRQCCSAGCIVQPVVQVMVPQHFKLFCKNYVRHKKRTYWSLEVKNCRNNFVIGA